MTPLLDTHKQPVLLLFHAARDQQLTAWRCTSEGREEDNPPPPPLTASIKRCKPFKERSLFHWHRGKTVKGKCDCTSVKWRWMQTLLCVFVYKENSTGQLWLDATHHFWKSLCSVNVEVCIALQTERDSVQRHLTDLKRKWNNLAANFPALLRNVLSMERFLVCTVSDFSSHGAISGAKICPTCTCLWGLSAR